MYSEPCARFTKSMMPKISVRPGRQQEQQQPELQAVEALFEDEKHRHPPPPSSAKADDP